ncbi:putative transcription regulator mTERF family [Dioscorea sansibarensis]
MVLMTLRLKTLFLGVQSSFLVILKMLEKTWRPKFEAFQALGFSGSNLRQLVLFNPIVPHQSLANSLQPRILFWRDILGSVENAMKLFKAKQWLLSYSLEQRVLPNLSLLREFGIPDNRITFIVQRQQDSFN